MPVPAPLSDDVLSATTDPAALLERAWALEPGLRLSERGATLARLERLLDDDGAGAAEPPGRSWRLELLAERAIDAATVDALEEARALADRVLAQADPAHEIAIARALFARGGVLAWTGTDASTREAERVLLEVAERCRVLDDAEWRGAALFKRANSVRQNGELPRAVELMGEALDVLGPDSPRRASVLTFRADTLASLGDLAAADAALAEAAELADRAGDAHSRGRCSSSPRATGSRSGSSGATRCSPRGRRSGPAGREPGSSPRGRSSRRTRAAARPSPAAASRS